MESARPASREIIDVVIHVNVIPLSTSSLVVVCITEACFIRALHCANHYTASTRSRSAYPMNEAEGGSSPPTDVSEIRDKRGETSSVTCIERQCRSK